MCPAVVKSLLEDIVRRIQNCSKCQAVAIRLNKDSDFPYYAQAGFPDFFILKENTLNVRDEKGKLTLDSDGKPVVECMCGNVLKSRVNPQSPFFTKRGTFWTNSTTQLLSSLTEKERLEVGKTRNTCHNFGYESVALVPIHANGKTIGLVQINDPRENMFTLEKVDKYQLLADRVGVIIWNLLKFSKETSVSRLPRQETNPVIA
jgi:hypothetical protein